MDGTRDHHVEQNKPSSERHMTYVFSHMQKPDLNDNSEDDGGSSGDDDMNQCKGGTLRG
jgi:hypothetical protein